jgi:sulfatase modifying factor 1
MKYLVLFAALFLLAGCGSFLPSEGQDAEASDAADLPVTSDAGDAATTLAPDVLASSGPPCVDKGMRRVGAVGQEFCIDMTEVTNVSYQFFVDANPSPTFRAECTWKTTHAWSLPSGSVYETGRGDWPVVGVDWCDADAYCAWAGKKLCSRERWSAACSGAGARKYSYGDSFDKNACNLDGQKEAVGTRASCTGAYDGVYDLLGNVEEWGDVPFVAGSSSNTDSTRTLGGLDCTSEGAAAVRALRSDAIGFRCCADD